MELKNILLTDFSLDNRIGEEVLEKQISKLKEQADKNILIGEFFGGGADHSLVSLKNVSHKINNICERKKKIYADVKFVDTENGKIAKELFSFGFTPEFKIRMRGSNRPDTPIDDLEIITWDVDMRPPVKFIRKDVAMFMENSFKGLSKKYILDAIFNEEIQKNWNPSVGDIIVGSTGNIFVISAEHSLAESMGGKKFFFGGGMCSRDGGNIMNETYCYTMNESGRNYTWVDGEIRPINDVYHSSYKDFRYVPYPHELVNT